jgi:hypothetical protein
MDPNRIIDHAISGGLRADAPWLIVLGVAFVVSFDSNASSRQLLPGYPGPP